MQSKPVNKSPQIGVRFPPDEMDRLIDHAERFYAGNKSTMVKVAVQRLMEAEQSTDEQSEQEQKAA